MNFNYSVTKGYKRYREAIRYGIVISVKKEGKDSIKRGKLVFPVSLTAENYHTFYSYFQPVREE